MRSTHSLQYEGVSLPQLSFIQRSALLSSFPTKQKLPRYSPESSIEPYWRLCHVTMETFPWHSPLQKETLTRDSGKAFWGGKDFNPGVKKQNKKTLQLSFAQTCNLNPARGHMVHFVGAFFSGFLCKIWSCRGSFLWIEIKANAAGPEPPKCYKQFTMNISFNTE